MALESFSIAPKGDQRLDTIYAFGRGLMARKIANGVVRENGKIVIYLLPSTAARYTMPSISGKADYAEDRDAVLSAIQAAG